MPATNNKVSAKRRLDLGGSSSSTTNTNRTKAVKNPYLKSAPVKSEARSTTNAEVVDAAAAASTVTPETGIEKFFVSKRKGEDAPKGQKRRSLQFNSEDDDTDGLYYHSDEEARTKNISKKKAKLYEPGYIHSSLGYHHRGELSLDHGTLNAYRFIRNHFLIPRDIETDPKFGPYSGSCFEERVIRAYSLGQLEPKEPKSGESLLSVCTYCGDEGHKRDDCLDLL